jgi:hypothetical protein
MLPGLVVALVVRLPQAEVLNGKTLLLMTAPLIHRAIAKSCGWSKEKGGVLWDCTFGDRLSSRNEPDHAAPQALDFSRNHPGRRTGLKFVF